MRYILLFLFLGLTGVAIWKIFTSAAFDRFLSNLSKKTDASTIQSEFDIANKRANNYNSTLDKTQQKINAEKHRVSNIKK
jgi:hypothetical protein